MRFDFRTIKEREHLANNQKMLYNENVVDTPHEALASSDFEVNLPAVAINPVATKWLQKILKINNPCGIHGLFAQKAN